ncbi:hypothetical protein RSAG8_08799, partial [Rhizoctonia solani AG-8 WAC10335]
MNIDHAPIMRFFSMDFAKPSFNLWTVGRLHVPGSKQIVNVATAASTVCPQPNALCGYEGSGSPRVVRILGIRPSNPANHMNARGILMTCPHRGEEAPGN